MALFFLGNLEITLILNMRAIILTGVLYKSNHKEFAMNILKRFALNIITSKLFVAALSLVVLVRDMPPMS